MPWHYTIDAERRVIVSRMWGRVTFLEALSHQNQLRSDPNFNPEFDQLIDATDVSTLSLSEAQAIRLAGTDFFSSESRRSFAAGTAAVFGLGRMMEVHYWIATNKRRTAVFYGLSSAMEWLELKDACLS
jgi:hypothetical protein